MATLGTCFDKISFAARSGRLQTPLSTHPGDTMNRKATRILVATVALVSMAGFAAPAEAAQLKLTARTGWCC
jgi:hypothetical protein